MQHVLNKQGATITKGLNMRNGTQEELDAAREDATLLPLKTLFKTKESGGNPSGFKVGKVCYRDGGSGMDENSSGRVRLVDGEIYYIDANDLEPIK